MTKKFSDIHQEVFDFLMKKHNEDRENFLFTLRKINRSERLDKGYWFLGNDKYLLISFWSGFDKLRKVPRISFLIENTGATGLIFSCKDADYPIFDPNLTDTLGLEEITEETHFRKYYKRFNDQDYIESLNNFLITDKVKVDEAIKNVEIHDYANDWPEFADQVDFLKEADFNSQIQKIKKYQVKKSDRIKNAGYLRSFKIQNYDLIKEINVDELNPENKWVFVTGENGSGKTTLLRALALGLSENNDSGKKIQDVGRGEIDVEVSTQGRSKTFSVSEGSFRTKKYGYDQGFAAYGAIRLFTGTSIGEGVHLDDPGRFERKTYGLFNPFGLLKDLSKSYLSIKDSKYYELKISSVLENLQLIMPFHEFTSLRDGELHFYFPNSKNKKADDAIPFSKLPSGTRNYVSLILDLLIRFGQHFPKEEDLSNYKGIVIIDEIDIHLHPKLQVELVKQLAETFPKIQFIVSTHSPIPLLGAPENSVVLKVTKNSSQEVEVNRLSKLESELPNLLPNTILTSEIFGFDLFKDVDEEGFESKIVEDNYDDYKKNQEVKKRLKNLNSDTLPDSLF